MKIRIRLWIRMVILIVSVLALSFYASTVLISNNFKEVAFRETFEFNDHHAYQYASIVKTQLDKSFEQLSALSQFVKLDSTINYDSTKNLHHKVLSDFLKENPNYIRLWTSHELSSIDENWQPNYGRIENSYTLTDGYVNIQTDSLDLYSEDYESLYMYVKLLPEEIIIDPVWHSYGNSMSDKELKADLLIPITKENEFAGVVGLEIGLDFLSQQIDSLSSDLNFDLMLFSFNGDIILSPNKKDIGKNIIEVDAILAKSFGILDRIQSGKNSNFSLKGVSGADSVSFAISSFTVGNTTTPWCVLVSSPLTSIKNEIDNMLSVTGNVGKLGLIVIAFVMLIFAFSLTKPLKRTTILVRKLAKGDVHGAEKISITTSDETRDMAASANTLVDGLKQVTDFAESIGKGKFDYKFEINNQNDKLGISIIEMRDSLADARKEAELRRIEEEHLNWASQGLNVFNRVLRVDNQDLPELCYSVIETLTTYLGAHMGGVYVKNNDKNDNYELMSHIGFTKEKFENKNTQPGEGIVGRCILEKDTIFINEVPADFTKVMSGLGRSIPRSILIVPLISNMKMIGVLEIESLKDIETYQISFVEKLAESIASTIASVKVNVRTSQLLNQSQKQAEELEQQEEEMRQNMEEMQATQEEASKREFELENLIKGFKDILLIAEYDYNGKLADINHNYQQILKVPKSQLIGKFHKSDVFLEESEQEIQKKLWDDLRKGHTKVLTEYYKTSKSDYWVEEHFIPVKTNHGIVTKILCIGIDITDQKKTESEIKRIKEGLNAGKVLGNNEGVEGKSVNLSTKLEIIDLTYLKMLYKKDPKKIYNILKLYSDTLPPQILELDDINKARDYKRLKSRINGLKTKMSYLGLKKVYEDFRKIEKLIASEKNLNQVAGLLQSVKNNWARASKELEILLG